MHITSVEHGFYGSYAIVGAHLPIACGLGWASRIQSTGRVVACFFGDAATNIGAFHEALNLATVWKLPVVFVCENNGYMEYTPIAEMISVGRPAADRASRPTGWSRSSWTAMTSRPYETWPAPPSRPPGTERALR